MNSKRICTYIISISVFFQWSCKKLVDIPPPVTSQNGENVYSSDPTAIAVMTGLYTQLSSGSFQFATGLRSISLHSGLAADEFALYSGVTDIGFASSYTNQLSTSSASTAPDYWQQFYQIIFHCNTALEGLNESFLLTPTVKQQLLGEALFMRAFSHFYLVNLYGKVPIVLSTDYTINASLSRADIDKVYEQIVKDLKEAQTLLSADFLDGNLAAYTSNRMRVRPTKWAATALLARVYLYNQEYAEAEKEASNLITNTQLFGLESSLNDVFLINSKEAIWQLQPVIGGHNTEDGWVFVLPPTGPSDVGFLGGYPVYLSNQLLSAFENGDVRRSDWVDSVIAGGNTYRFPFKYKSATLDAPVTEYLMVFRLAEQFLIRAEARAHQGNTSGALEDIDVIRTRAGLPDAVATTPEELDNIILHERQVELFSEWGHRWLDLKRIGKVDEVMNVVTPFKGGTWETTDQLYPLPPDDILKDPHLEQNPSY